MIPPASTRVLVIDDEPRIVAYVMAHLELAGFSVEGAFGGAEGIAKAKQSVPDVVFCDMMMPQMSGLEVVWALRSEPSLAGARLLLTTAVDTFEPRPQYPGVDAVVTKPYHPDEVVRAVQEFCGE